MEPLRLTVFDVGDGLCLLVRSPGGRYGVIDTCVRPGGGVHPILDHLAAEGVRELSFLCLTHPHRDHFTGMLPLIEQRDCRILEFWHTVSDLDLVMSFWNQVPEYTGWDDLSAHYARENVEELVRALSAVFADTGIRKRRLHCGVRLPKLDGVDVHCLGPHPARQESYVAQLADRGGRFETLDKRHVNDLSAVLLLQYGSAAVLLPADLPGGNWEDIMQELSAIGCETPTAARVFGAAHHGSVDGIVPGRFLRRLVVQSGACVLVSAGGGLRPSAEFLTIAMSLGNVWCTRQPQALRAAMLRDVPDPLTVSGLDMASQGTQAPVHHGGDIVVEITATSHVSVNGLPVG
jgi:hypothetical protein